MPSVSEVVIHVLLYVMPVSSLVIPTAEVLAESQDYQIPCNAKFSFNQVYSFNWLFNGTFIHPSLNPGVTVLTDGSLNIDSVQPAHTGRLLVVSKFTILLSNLEIL